MDLLPQNTAQQQSIITHLRNEEVIILPTDTIWGLHAVAKSSAAITKIQNIKQRPIDKPMVLLMADMMMTLEYVELCPLTRHLMSDLGDRGLTVLAPRKKGVLPNYFPKFAKLAVRTPNTTAICKIIHELHTPIVSTSVNRSGKPHFNTIPEMIKELANDDCLLAENHDFTPNNNASTIIEVNKNRITLKRTGTITENDIAKSLEKYHQDGYNQM